MATEKLFDEGLEDAADEEAISRSAILNQRDEATEKAGNKSSRCGASHQATREQVAGKTYPNRQKILKIHQPVADAKHLKPIENS